MSNGYAIAAVTAAIRHQISEGLSADKVGDIVGSFSVTALPPDRIVKPNTPDPTQINLFLHQVTPNAGWRNVDLPSRGANGEAVTAPPIAVNLHYLVSAYANDMYVAEILLGHALRILHENAVLSRETVRRALTPAAPDPLLTALRQSDLAEQIELIKIVPEAVNTEDMSRLWSAFQANYRPTAAYQVSVVLIESRSAAHPALPIRRRGVQGDNLALPLIEAVEAQSGRFDPVTTDDAIVIRGQRLRGEGSTTVTIGGVDIVPDAGDLGSTAITIDLAAASPAPFAGLNGVTVTQPVDFGDPPTPHHGRVSNLIPVVIRPVISGTAAANSDVVTTGGVDYATGQLSVTVSRAVGQSQKVELLLNEFGAPSGRTPRSYSFAMKRGNGVVPPATETATLAIPYRGVARGSYLVRLRVDGADSILTTDALGRYDGPQEVI